MKYIRSFDTRAAALVAKIPKKYTAFVNAITTMGSFWLVATSMSILGIIAVTSGRRDLLLNIGLMLVLSPLAEAAKYITRRKRPKTLYVENMRFKTYSFPSGHAYVSALTCGYLITLALIYVAAPLNIIASAVLVIFAGAVGISRVYLGAHFPSDVLGGWVLAGLMLALTTPSRAGLV